MTENMIVDLFGPTEGSPQEPESHEVTELRQKIWAMEREKHLADVNIEALRHKIARAKAKTVFVEKSDFLLRELLDRYDSFIGKVDSSLKKRDLKSLEEVVNKEINAINNLNLYIGIDNKEDILYDLGKQKVYDKIKKNAHDQRKGEAVRRSRVREADWVDVPSK